MKSILAMLITTCFLAGGSSDGLYDMLNLIDGLSLHEGSHMYGASDLSGSKIQNESLCLHAGFDLNGGLHHHVDLLTHGSIKPSGDPGQVNDAYPDNDLHRNSDSEHMPSEASAPGLNDVRNYGAAGDGVTDDTQAIRRAVRESEGSILFSEGLFRITETIEIPVSATGRAGIRGDAGTGTVIMAGSGPAFRIVGTHHGTSNPASVNEEVWLNERMPVVENLEIQGDHAEADGLEFSHSMQPVVRGVLIREVRHGIVLRERIRNFILDSSHIYNCSGTGLFLDRVNLHQINVQGSHLSYCKQGAIRVVGSEIRNLQITGNDIEYNYDPEADQSADIWIDVRQGSVREGTITGNTIQSVPSPGGANIRFTGAGDTYDKAGLWSITGNHISNAYKNIHITGGRGFTVTGNSFIRGIDRNLMVEESRNIVFSSNSIDNNPDYREEAGNGVTIRNSRGVLLTALQLEQAGKVEGRRGAVEILNSSEVTLAGCQLFNPAPTGIFVEDSQNIQIDQCLIRTAEGRAGLAASIEVAGYSENVFIRNNLTTTGSRGAILTLPGTSLLEGNHSID